MSKWRKVGIIDTGPAAGLCQFYLDERLITLPESLGDRILADHKAAEELAALIGVDLGTATIADQQKEIRDLRSQLAAAREALEKIAAHIEHAYITDYARDVLSRIEKAEV